MDSNESLWGKIPGFPSQAVKKGAGGAMLLWAHLSRKGWQHGHEGYYGSMARPVRMNYPDRFYHVSTH